RMIAAQADLPIRVAGFRVHTACDAVITDHIELLANQKRRWCQRYASLERPRDVRFRNVPAPIQTNRQQRRLLKSCANEDHPISKSGSRHIRKSLAVSYLPEFLSRARFIGNRAESARTDELIALGKPHNQRGRIGLIAFAELLPSNLTGLLVQRNYILNVLTVAAHDQ